MSYIPYRIYFFCVYAVKRGEIKMENKHVCQSDQLAFHFVGTLITTYYKKIMSKTINYRKAKSSPSSGCLEM